MRTIENQRKGILALATCFLAVAVLLILVTPLMGDMVEEEKTVLENMVLDDGQAVGLGKDEVLVDQDTYDVQQNRVESLQNISWMIWLAIVACLSAGTVGAVIGSGWTPRQSQGMEKMDSVLGQDENRTDFASLKDAMDVIGIPFEVLKCPGCGKTAGIPSEGSTFTCPHCKSEISAANVYTDMKQL